MRRVLVACVLVRGCRVVVGHEADRGVALIRKDEVGSQVVLLSVVEELVELFVRAQVLQEMSVTIAGSSKQHIHTICGSIEEGHLALRKLEVSEQVAAALETFHSHGGSVFCTRSSEGAKQFQSSV